jgi:hypothetical protein
MACSWQENVKVYIRGIHGCMASWLTDCHKGSESSVLCASVGYMISGCHIANLNLLIGNLASKRSANVLPAWDVVCYQYATNKLRSHAYVSCIAPPASSTCSSHLLCRAHSLCEPKTFYQKTSVCLLTTFPLTLYCISHQLHPTCGMCYIIHSLSSCL